MEWTKQAASESARFDYALGVDPHKIGVRVAVSRGSWGVDVRAAPAWEWIERHGYDAQLRLREAKVSKRLPKDADEQAIQMVALSLAHIIADLCADDA